MRNGTAEVRNQIGHQGINFRHSQFTGLHNVCGIGTGAAHGFVGSNIMKLKIDLSRTALPEEGKRPAVFVDVVQGSVKDKRLRDVLTLTLIAQLAKSPKELLRHTVTRDFRLDTKGMKKLKAEVEAWLGKPLSADQLAQFDPEAEFIGKSALVNVIHDTENGRPVAKFAEFEPTTEIVKAEGYVRKTEPEAASEDKG